MYLSDFPKIILSYTLSFAVSIFLLTYLLNLPILITQKKDIVNEYYIKNYLTNIPLDYFFIYIYLVISYLVMYILKLKDNSSKILIVALVTALITGGFCFYFRSYPMNSNFFSKWFHTVGYSSVLYDVILLVFVYIIFLYLQEKTK